MINIKKQIIDTKSKYGIKNPKNYITIHETGNTNETANAQAHANLQKRGYPASWHYQIDQDEIIQSFPHNYQLWHAGDGKGKGNMESIAIEMCVNTGNDYIKTIKNTVALIKKIIAEENIPIENIVQHNYWSKKNCPFLLRNNHRGINWNQFINLIKENENKKYEILKIDGFMGKKTISRLQQYLGTPIDGKISKPSAVIKELQRRLNKDKL